ncbi:MAG: aerotaxis receptor Aer [Epsilonproteobacteria bacterium]|nr:MAG: aerotaxis receptor Aer [Campylobacterota bacterium]
MKKPIPVDEQYFFDGGLIIGSTDLDGIITYVNRKFCEITGYTKDELLGQGHNIIRHPDMPKTIFKELWIAIRSNKEWMGIIKNIRKDGFYYWSYSHITPIIIDKKVIGYTAAVRPATPDEIAESIPVYENLLNQE